MSSLGSRCLGIQVFTFLLLLFWLENSTLVYFCMLSPKRGSRTLKDMEILSTYVTHPCDSCALDTQFVGHTTIYVKVIVVDSQP